MITSERIEGLEAFAKALRELPQRIARNDLQAAVAAGGRVIRDEARLRAPVYHGRVAEGHAPPGTLRKSIILKAIRELSTQERRVVFVLVRHGKKFQKTGKKGTNLDAFYWHMVEFGTRKMQPRPFMRPAFESRKRDAIEAIKTTLGERLEQHKRDLSW